MNHWDNRIYESNARMRNPDEESCYVCCSNSVFTDYNLCPCCRVKICSYCLKKHKNESLCFPLIRLQVP